MLDVTTHEIVWLCLDWLFLCTFFNYFFFVLADNIIRFFSITLFGPVYIFNLFICTQCTYVISDFCKML